jgi:ATPase family associated with various cellular activities (AAA)
MRARRFRAARRLLLTPVVRHAVTMLPSVAERASELFDRELERVRLRALVAVEQSSSTPNDELLSQAVNAIAHLEADLVERRPRGRAAHLAERLGLGDRDLDLLWAAVALAADPEVLPHMEVLGGTAVRRGLPLWVYARVCGLSSSELRALARDLVDDHPLLRAHLLEWDDRADSPVARALVVPAGTIAWLGGSDKAEAPLRFVPPPDQLEVDAAQAAVVDRLSGLLARASAPVVTVVGASGSGRGAALASAAEGPVIALDCARVAVTPVRLTALRRQCALHDALPLLANLDAAFTEEATAPALRAEIAHALDALDGPVAVTVSHAGFELPVGRPTARLTWPLPDLDTRRRLWARLSPGLAVDVIEPIASRYQLGAGGIARAVEASRAGASLVDGIRDSIANRFGELAQPVAVSQRWDDLVLEPALLDQVNAFIARVRFAGKVFGDWGFGAKVQKGLGAAALFSGPPGTGKTMVAGLIARALDLELVQVDLSKVMSKWVGETERQLARLFDAAEAGHALLLFDEADSLFARRTEVRSSADRYANLEVNYLLQRLESFSGVTILTTNLDVQLDPALRRRLAARIVFQPPEADERHRLWAQLLAGKAPFEGPLDLDELVHRYPEMSGANIRNAVLAAAFLAAAEGTALTQPHLERAARAEYASMGHVLANH